MKVLVLIVALLILGQTEHIVNSLQFESNEVSSYRAMVARQNFQTIQKHNENPERTFDMKVNARFMGLTIQEFRELYLMKVDKEDKPEVQMPSARVQSVSSKIMGSTGKLFSKVGAS